MKVTIWSNNTNLVQCAADEDKIIKYKDEYYYYLYCRENEVNEVEEIDDSPAYHEEGYTQWQYDRGEVNYE